MKFSTIFKSWHYNDIRSSWNRKIFLLDMFQFRLGSYYFLKTWHWKWWQWKVGIEIFQSFLSENLNFWLKNLKFFSLKNHPRAFPKAESKTMLASFSSEFYSVEVRAVEVPRSSSILLRTFAISKVSRETLLRKGVMLFSFMDSACMQIMHVQPCMCEAT